MKIELNCRERERIYDLIIKEREFYAPCGGKGICGKCKIKTISGKFNEVTEEEKKFLTDKEIQSRGIGSPATTWRRVKAGTFPAPISLSPRMTRWRLSDVEAWEAQRAALSMQHGGEK